MKLFMMTLIFTLFSFSPLPSWGDEPSTEANNEPKNYKVFQIYTEVNSIKYRADVYQPLQLKIKYMLVISPTIKGVTVIEESNAQYFSNRGYVVIIPYPYPTEMNNPNPNVEKLNTDFYQPTISAKSLINAVDLKLNLPPSTPIFTLGASQGAFSTIIITANNPRVKAAWFAVGGGDLPYIYAYSDVEQLIKFRVNHMKKLGMTRPSQYEQYLRLHLTNDTTIACKDITVPFHQTIATRDTAVPTITQELLADECPSHSVSRRNYNHSSGTLSTVLDRQEIMDFFESAI